MNPDPASLDRLHDIIAPPPVPWWPPAPGWYGLLGILLVLLVAAAVRGFIRWQRNRYRREALAEWRRLQPLFATADRRAFALGSLAELLKRTALSAFPRERVAALTGPAWLAFLDRTGPRSGFSTDAGAMIETAAYDPQAASAAGDSQIEEATALAHDWLAQHRAEAAKGDAGC